MAETAGSARRSVMSLEALNFFWRMCRRAGAFLAAHFAASGWNPWRVGYALTFGGLVCVAMQTSARRKAEFGGARIGVRSVMKLPVGSWRYKGGATPRVALWSALGWRRGSRLKRRDSRSYFRYVRGSLSEELMISCSANFEAREFVVAPAACRRGW